jgi:hypothetical protein
MHRLLINAPAEVVVDHKNGDGLDNRICNLRACTNIQNLRNRKMQSTNKTGIANVYWNARLGYYVVAFRVGDNKRRCYYRKSLADASLLSEVLRKELHGEFASTRI